MEIGLKPKVNNINIKKIGKQYEINFGDEIWIYVGSRKDLTELRDKINNAIEDKTDNKFEIIREAGMMIKELKESGVIKDD